MTPLCRVVFLLAATSFFVAAAREVAAQAPAGQAVQAWHVTIAPSWFDPSTAPPQITPFGLPAGVIVPRVMDFALQVEPPPYDPQKAKQLLAEAGYPNGLDAGEFVGIPGFPTVTDSVANYLNAVGIRMKIRPMERAAFYAAWREKKLRGLFLTAVGNSGNAATRVEAFIQSKGAYAYGGYPDIDDLFQQQVRERDPRKREAILHRIQQLTIDRVMFAPVMDLRVLMGVGPRVAEHTITQVWMSPFPSHEDMKLKP